MNDSSSSNFFADVKHAGTGAKVISTCLSLLNFGIATAIAWSCSSFLVALIAFIVSALVGALIILLVMLAWAAFATDSVIAVGKYYEQFTDWLATKFDRSPAPAAA